MKQNDEKKKLIKSLNRIDARLKILDRIEDRLVKMKELAERVVSEDLEEEEIQNLNQEVQELVKEVELLDTARTEYTYHQ